jgi:hypothetical protein
MKIDKAQDKDFAAINRNCLVYIWIWDKSF